MTSLRRSTLREIDLPGLGQLYRGKVRDSYRRDDRIVMITTDRVSAALVKALDLMRERHKMPVFALNPVAMKGEP